MTSELLSQTCSVCGFRWIRQRPELSHRSRLNSSHFVLKCCIFISHCHRFLIVSHGVAADCMSVLLDVIAVFWKRLWILMCVWGIKLSALTPSRFVWQAGECLFLSWDQKKVPYFILQINLCQLKFVIKLQKLPRPSGPTGTFESWYDPSWLIEMQKLCASLCCRLNFLHRKL